MKSMAHGMEFVGKVQGEYARRFPEFCYRRPVMRPLEPEHPPLSVLSEYPRFIRPVAAHAHIPVLELADYTVIVGEMDDSCMSVVQLWMKPNGYTLAKAPRIKCEFKASHAFTMRHKLHDLALSRVFGGGA